MLRADRLHLHYGPIDLVIDVDADAHAVKLSHNAARQAFDGVLEALVQELPQLRKPVCVAATPPGGEVAKRMWAACLPHAQEFVTAMAAVAGAVADHVLHAMVRKVPQVQRVWVNNGGDIALWLNQGQSTRLAVCGYDGARAATVTVQASDGVHGVATSGWQGRSYSLGIADAVTVLAPSAAAADVAATLIANAVQLPASTADTLWVERKAASELSSDSDLGDRKVTVAVSKLPNELKQAAVQQGLRAAQHLQKRASLFAVFIDCQGHRASIGDCT